MTNTPPTDKRLYWLAGNREDGQDRFFREALDPDIWAPGDAGHWDACWYTGMPDPDVFEQLTPRKWINHIPGNNALTIKSRLAETLAEAQARMAAEEGLHGEGPRRLAFAPETYPMPQAYHALQAAAHAEPDARWILKPKNSSRGRDIALVPDTGTVPVGDRWMVQRYLHDPHLMRGHKYVLRLYVLITSAEPLRVYLYHEGFAKLASEPYDLDGCCNVFSHLTNPDVNATNEEAASPVVFVPLNEYRSWLRDGGHDDGALFSAIRDLVTLTAISARKYLRRRLRGIRADTSGCYELLGIDCLVDAGLKPWILECNLSPSLDICAAPQDGGDAELAIKRQLVHDMVRMLGFNRPWPERTEPDPAARILAEAEMEMAHRGGWERLCPHGNPEEYLPFFPMPRLADMVIGDAAAGRPVERPVLRAFRCHEVVGDQQLAVYAEETGTLYRLNDTAAWIWLNATGGKDPDRIADELAALRQPDGAGDTWSVRSEVWDQLADWAELGLLRKSREDRGDVEDGREPRQTRAPVAAGRGNRAGRPEAGPLSVRCGGMRIRILPGSGPVRGRLAPLLAASSADASVPEELTLRVFESEAGYALTLDGRLVATEVLLAGIAPVVCDVLATAAFGGEDSMGMAGTLLEVPGEAGEAPRSVFVASLHDDTWDAVAIRLAGELGAAFSCGLRIGNGENGPVHPIGLPARVTEEGLTKLAERGFQSAPVAGKIQIWPDGARGHLVPATAGPPKRPVTVSAVIVPRRQRQEPGLQPCSADVALGALLSGCRDRSGARPTVRQVERLHGWLERRTLWSMDADFSEAFSGALPRTLSEALRAASLVAS